MISNFYHPVVLSHRLKPPKVILKRGVSLDCQCSTSERQAGAAVEGSMQTTHWSKISSTKISHVSVRYPEVN